MGRYEGAGDVVRALQDVALDVAPGQTVTVDLVSMGPYVAGSTKYQFQADASF